jgi:hypothetical protein
LWRWNSEGREDRKTELVGMKSIRAEARTIVLSRNQKKRKRLARAVALKSKSLTGQDDSWDGMRSKLVFDAEYAVSEAVTRPGDTGPPCTLFRTCLQPHPPSSPEPLCIPKFFRISSYHGVQRICGADLTFGSVAKLECCERRADSLA